MRVPTAFPIALLVLTVSFPGTIARAQAPVPAPAPGAEKGAADAAKPAPAAEPWRPAPQLSTTSHAGRIGGRDIRYTATTGMLPLRDESGKHKADIFFVAYTRDDAGDARSRPITFSYNGGPGSASVWLHMGALGPKRVDMGAEGFQPAPPYRLLDNDSSLLDVTDLVMIDPVSTGYSRAAAGESAKQFHGVYEDIKSVAEFIRRYLVQFDRWASPKFLLGESYGTMRSAGLSGELQSVHGIELNGIVLVSSILDYMTKGYAPGNDMPYVLFLPTYTATAWYHKRLPADLQSDLKKAVEESRQFASGEYTLALFKGSRLSAQEKAAVAKKLARYTGLAEDYLLQSHLRVTDVRFRKELLRDRGVMVGRLDGRFTALDADAAGERQEFDPSNTALQGPYTALFTDYIRRELKFQSELSYETSGNVRPWNYGEFSNRYLNLVDTLRGAMARNTHLRVFVANGYYDFATPFHATEFTFSHLGFEPTYQERVQFAYYDGGHMFYIRPGELKRFKTDVTTFIQSASAAGTVVPTSQPPH